MLALGLARLDTEKQVITLGSRTVALQRKPYLVLVCLIENRHRLVSRKELLDRFWDGQEVYDQNLSKAVATIRRALGDAEESEFIETRWGLGYRYIGPCEELPASSTGTATPPRSGMPPAVPSRSGTDASSTSKRSADLRSAIRAGSTSRAAYVLVAACIVVAATSAFLLFGRYPGARRTAPVAPGGSVAVLPFTPNAGDVEDEYAGLEIADALTARLSTIPQLNVRPASTVRQVVGLEPDPSAAAKDLQVSLLVTGSLHRTTDGVAVLAQLLNSSTKSVLWSGSFSIHGNEYFAAEDRIAQQLARALLPQAGASALKLSSGPGTISLEAYSDSMKAQFFATRRTRESLARAVTLLKDATAIDPGYAEAFAQIAECYALEGFYQFVPPGEAYPEAKAAATRALSLDNSLSDAHLALLSILTDYDWDWNGSEREFRSAIAIDPQDAVAYQYYGYTLIGMGRGDEALAAMQQAAQIDPVSPSIQTSMAWVDYLLRRNQQAVSQCRHVLALYPRFVPAHQLLGLTYEEMGMSDLALTELRHAGALENDSATTPLSIDYVLARDGHQAEAVRDLTELQARKGESFIPDYFLAVAWTAVGDRQKAEAFLARACQARSNWIIFLRYDPRLDPLRNDVGFRDLLQRVEQPSLR